MSDGLRGVRLPLAAVLAVAALLGAAGARGAPDPDPVEARAFEVRYRTLTDAADLVGPLLSDAGTLTLRPRLKTLIVEDHRSVLSRVAGVLRDFDVPPRSVEVVLSLFLGSDRRAEAAHPHAAGGVLSRDVRGVIEALGDFTKWTEYESLGSRSVSGVEGREVTAGLSGEYRVVFLIDAVDEERGIVSFRHFTLQRLRRGAQGDPEVEDLYTTGMLLGAERLHVVGAASGPDSSQALFLTLRVTSR